MNIIHIFGITILLMGGTDSLIEDAKTDKNNQQRILLRKLQNLQPEQVKPSTWNEVLADVLVNKIRIFSFKNQDKEDVIKADTLSKDKTILADFFSSVLIVYKKIYDTFGTPESKSDINATPIQPKSAEDGKKVEFEVESEDIIKPTEGAFGSGPKSEVELVEPKYHGKIALEEVTTTEIPIFKETSPKVREINVIKENDSENFETKSKVPIDKNNESNESVDCGEGLVRGENGNCVKNNSRLLLAVPYQCPLGYRMDFLGNCRMIFHF